MPDPRGKYNYVIFGGLAIWLCSHNLRPMTLRPCFSAGLRFIGYFLIKSLAQTKSFALFNFEILPFIIAKYLSLYFIDNLQLSIVFNQSHHPNILNNTCVLHKTQHVFRNTGKRFVMVNDQSMVPWLCLCMVVVKNDFLRIIFKIRSFYLFIQIDLKSHTVNLNKHSDF